MVCPNCSGENEESAVSCRKCGTALRARAAAATQTFGGVAIGLAPSPVPSFDTLPAPSSSAAPDDFPNLGSRYRVERKLGEGGMGAVYKAWDTDLERPVAVKLMRRELVSHPESLLRFKQELLLASKISHRNILRIYDLAEAGGTRFFTMAFIDGEDLSSLIARKGAMTVEEATAIALQICAALEAAHREGVVHRDLKPENILVDGNKQVYVSDFGLSTSVEPTNATRLTISGQSIGTPRYMSPEQVQSRDVDHRSDLYSFGLILYEMLTAQAPFSGNSVFEQMFQRVQGTPRPPSDFRPGLPAYMQNIVLRCLERDPANRYQSAAEIAHDLQAQTAEALPVAPEHQRSITIQLPTKNRRGTVLLLGAALFAGASGLAYYWYGRPSTVSSVPAYLKRVAIAPFQVVGSEPQLQLIAEGFQDALSANLSALKSVNTSMAAANAPVSELAKKYGVRYVITGTLGGTPDRFRLLARLEDSTGKEPPKSFTIEGVPNDILTLEDQLLNQVTAGLGISRTGDEVAGSNTHTTGDVKAYDLYLQGKDALRGSQSPKTLQTAVHAFESAVQIDPKFALGYASLASASLQMYLQTKDPVWAQRATGAAQQARSLDPNLPEAHFAAAFVYTNTGRNAEAVAELGSALKLAPNSDEGYRRLAQTYLAAGEHDQAIEAAQHSVDLNPYFWSNYYVLGQVYQKAGQAQKSLEAFQKVVSLDPQNAAGYRNIGIALFNAGKMQESIEPFQKSLQLEPTYQTYSNLGTAFFYLRRYTDAVEMYQEALDLNPRDQTVAGNLGDAYRANGEPTKADSMYRKAIELAGEDLKINPKRADTLSLMAVYYAKMGDSVRSLPLIQRARKIDANDVNLMSDEAIINTLVGRYDDAFAALETALAHGYAVSDADAEPELKSLRTDPRYKQITAKYRH